MKDILTGRYRMGMLGMLYNYNCICGSLMNLHSTKDGVAYLICDNCGNKRLLPSKLKPKRVQKPAKQRARVLDEDYQNRGGLTGYLSSVIRTIIFQKLETLKWYALLPRTVNLLSRLYSGQLI